MKHLKNFLVALIIALFPVFITANNIEVNNVELKNHNTTPGSEYIEISFDISWENSWRNATNHDAAWVFAKYQYGDEPWGHVIIHDSDYSAPAGSEIIIPDDQVGFFIQRDVNGAGSVNWEDVVIRWRYKADNDLDDLDEIIVNVYAIEMVYVPEGAFYVGDGNTANILGVFHEIGTAEPFQITSEGALTLGGTTAGNLGNNHDGSGQEAGFSDDYNINNPASEKTLPADFPKGYQAFYAMKYNITQKQYVDFLNTLTRSQQNRRTGANLASSLTSTATRYVMSVADSPTSRNGIRVNYTFEANKPLTFYNDLNDDGSPNQDDDGQHLPCNYLAFADGSAYLDWAGLRPMTELEFEKAARGTAIPILNEMAWGEAYNLGTTAIVITGITNSGEENELPTNADANCHINNNDGVIDGPVRAGIFATSTSNRAKAGATYYGIMDMGGTLIEQVISTGTPEGRSFDGQHGDGELASTGVNNVSNWPGSNSTSIADVIGAGLRSNGYTSIGQGSRISVRRFVNQSATGRSRSYGYRGARTAP